MPDSSPVRVKLLGPPGVFAGEAQERVRFPYKKTEGIFYYICMKKQVTRDELISVFWADSDEQTGRKNLRQALYEIKKALPQEPVKTSGQSRLFMDPAVSCTSDWDLPDERFLTEGGEFLRYFYVKGAPGFEDWVDECRLQQKERCRRAARKAIAEAVPREDIKRLQKVLSAWQKLEPYEEDVVREAVEAYSACGKYTMALQTYHEYRDLIAKELEEEPGEDLTQLVQQVMRMKESDTGRGTPVRERFYCRNKESFDISRTLDMFSYGKATGSVVITGDAGVGRSALLRHIANIPQKNNIYIFTTHCYETEKNYYLKAFREWFKWLEKYVDDGRIRLPEEYIRLIHQIFAEHEHFTPGQGRTTEIFGASGYPVWENKVLAMLRIIAEKKKIVLFIDDMQWMDELSRQLLHRLMLEAGADRFCFIGTYRATEEGPNLDFLHRMERHGMVRFIRILPFTEEETAEIIREELGTDTDHTLATRIWQRTDGNALFLMDLISMVKEEGWDATSIPPKSEYVIRAKLRNITPLQRQILNALSIYMEHAELYELEILVKTDRLTLLEELENLQKRRIIRELAAGEYIAYEFCHHYYKEYVYNEQPLAKRRYMHQMVAEAYEALKEHRRWLEHIPFLIYQYEKSGDHEKAESYRKEYESLIGR